MPGKKNLTMFSKATINQSFKLTIHDIYVFILVIGLITLVAFMNTGDMTLVCFHKERKHNALFLLNDEKNTKRLSCSISQKGNLGQSWEQKFAISYSLLIT